MNNKKQKIVSFSRRAFILLTAKLSFVAVLLSRMFYLQIIKHKEYQTLADGNRIKFLLELPIRGIIVDRFGNNLAVNQKYYRIFYYKNANKNYSKILKAIIEILELPEEYYKIWERKIKTSAEKRILLKEHLSWQDVCKISVRQYDLIGLELDLGQMRFYPFSYLTAHIIGYVGPISEDQKHNNNNKLFSHPDYRVGKTGIEKSQADILTGLPGFKKIEVNAYGNLVRELSYSPATSGEDLPLTIDIKMQDFMNNTLEAYSNKGGSALLMDITNGHLLGMVSNPSYDPNKFTQGISHADWSTLINDPYKPLLNRCIRNAYPPGSTFKPVVFLAALEEGISPDHLIHCSGGTQVGNRVFHCWKKEGHGPLNMVEAIARSCNVYLYTIAKRIGVNKIMAVAHKLGLGQTVLNEISGELAGILPTNKWKQAEIGQSWQLGDTINVSIGQGYLLATPVQLLTMIARIASGRNVLPTLIASKQQEFESLNINENHFKVIRQGLIHGSNAPYGTSFYSRITIDKYKMAAKTGTAQVISKKNPNIDLSADHIAYENKNHGFFIAYAPVHEPRFACCVMVDHGAAGSKVAGIGRDIMLEVQKKYTNNPDDPAN